VASASKPDEILEIIAGELCLGIDRALNHWMIAVELAVNEPNLSTQERLEAVRQIVRDYKAQSRSAGSAGLN
jgi:hypothetical protein